MNFERNIFFIIFVGLLISSTTSFLNLNKYDQIDGQPHSMINGDSKLIWIEAEQLKRIADAIEEILRIVKKDMEPKKK